MSNVCVFVATRVNTFSTLPRRRQLVERPKNEIAFQIVDLRRVCIVEKEWC